MLDLRVGPSFGRRRGDRELERSLPVQALDSGALRPRRDPKLYVYSILRVTDEVLSLSLDLSFGLSHACVRSGWPGRSCAPWSRQSASCPRRRTRQRRGPLRLAWAPLGPPPVRYRIWEKQ